MRKRTLKSSLAAISAIVALGTMVLGTSPAAAYQCQNGHHYEQGYGQHTQIQVAQAIAKKSWQNKIKGEYGLAWSVWQIAKGKQLNCTAAAGGTKFCVARARPCKYVTG